MKITSVYLASSFRKTKMLMRDYAAILRLRGLKVTNTWIDSESQSDPLNDGEACREVAFSCLHDVSMADTIVYFTEHESVGKHVELGYAIAYGKHVIVVGEPTSVFHYLPSVELLPSWSAFLGLLESER